jgi:YHS domain-containing protein
MLLVVDVRCARAHLELAGTEYWFCADACLRQFVAAPR